MYESLHTIVRTEPLMQRPAHARPRVELLDNAKAVLIVCVVLYHTTVVYTSADRPEVLSLRPAVSGPASVVRVRRLSMRTPVCRRQPSQSLRDSLR